MRKEKKREKHVMCKKKGKEETEEIKARQEKKKMRKVRWRDGNYFLLTALND